MAKCQGMILARKAALKKKNADERARLEAVERAARATAATTTTSTTAAPTMRGPKIETLSLPEFTGQLKDYARFRRDWKNLVGKTMADEIQLMYIKDKVPKKVRDLVDGLSTMNDC